MLKKRHVAVALVALIAAALLAATPASASTNFDGTSASGLLWSDEFTGLPGAAPDVATWAYDQGPYGSNGQGELECYTNSRQNSALDGFGDLVITVRSAPNTSCWPIRRDYTSARLTTQNKITLQYGRVEVRATMPTTTGMFPAIWALGDNYSSVGWPTQGEIDIAETQSHTPTLIYQSIHGPTDSGGASTFGNNTNLGERASVEPHVYGMTWGPDSVSFDIDGVTTYTVQRSSVDAGGTWVFDHPFYLVMNVAVGGWAPAPDATTALPQSMTIDYVRVYGLDD